MISNFISNFRILSAGVCLMFAGMTHAEPWRSSAAMYGQFAGMSGDIAVGDVTADIDVSFDELLDDVDVAGMMVLRNENDRFALSVNAAFVGLGAEGGGASGTFFDVDVTQDLVELTWSWRLDERYELYVGGRYQSLAIDITAVAPSGASSEALRTKDLVDPIVGARGAWPIAASWTLIARADIGGFGVGSDLTWSALAVIDWSVSQNFGVVVGYRALDTDYEDDSGDRFVEFNTLVAGPLIGVRFDFGS